MIAGCIIDSRFIRKFYIESFCHKSESAYLARLKIIHYIPEDSYKFFVEMGYIF